jgi:hypothetical protein
MVNQDDYLRFAFPRFFSVFVFLCHWSLVIGHWSLNTAFAQPPPDTTTLRGKVRQRGDEPVARAQVTLRRVSKPNQATALWGAQTTTNDEGDYVFPEVEEGLYTLTVIAKDFAELTSDLVEVKGAQPVTLRPFVLSPPPRVNGRLVNWRDAAVADADVRVTLQWESVVNKRRETRWTEQQIRTDAEGRYSLPLRGAGAGAFFVQAPGKGWAVSPRLTVEQSDHVEGVNLQLRRGGDILVLLVSRDTKEPIINANVSAQFQPTPTSRLPFRPSLSGRTGNDGKCRFSEVPPGYWTVSASAADAPFGSARSQTVYVAAEDTAGAMLDVFSGATVSVHVFAPDAQSPMPNANVRLDNGETRVTNEQGVCVFSHVGAGDHKVFVRAEGLATSAQVFKLTEEMRQARVNVLMRSANGGIAGSVRDANGKPIPRAFVSAVSLPVGAAFAQPLWAWADAGWRETIVQRLDRYTDDATTEADASGAFVLNGLAPGRYVLFAPMIQPPDAVSAVVVVEAGKTTEGINVTVDALCHYHVGGRILRADGSPLRNATVPMVVRVNDGKYLTIARFLLSTDEQGRYFFMRRGAGIYFIETAVEGEGVAKIWRDVRGEEIINALDLRLQR